MSLCLCTGEKLSLLSPGKMESVLGQSALVLELIERDVASFFLRLAWDSRQICAFPCSSLEQETAQFPGEVH
jgi:hypothetical protein